jgi:nucleotide-binding universal stress UspA family protein
VTTIAEIEERQALEILAKAKDRFIRVAGSNDRVEWRQELGFATDTVLQQARAADLVVTSRPSLNDAGSDADPGELLMRAARPILFVPPGIDHVSAKHIIVGWKDTREARRAVIDALPLLARAQEVTVLSVGSEDSGATDVAAYLGYHAIVALAVNRTIADEEAAEEILRLAEAKAADLIVCGGYGHSRAREWVFGGATRTLLYSSARCCLMTH